MRRALIVLAVLALAPLGVAHAQNPDTGGVTQADADSACAAVMGQPVPDAALVAGFRAAYNTVDNTDDGPASVGLSPQWQRLIYLEELHIDYLGLSGLDDSATFTCTGGTAAFPALAPADDVAAAVCGNPALDDIADPALRARVEAALAALAQEYADLRADCVPDPTVTPTPTVTPGPTPPPADINCGDVTDAQAQVILDADPSDPNGLDADSDGDACDDGNFTDVGRAPVGPVATGG